MSSTNRGGDRHISDYYVTPQWAILDFLTAFRKDRDGFKVTDILDPCAGGDEKNEMAYPTALRKFGWPEHEKLWTVDCREDSKAEIHQDFLAWKPIQRFGLIITNPPFALAQEVIEHSLELGSGYVVMLLRLNFFGGKKRFEFWQKNMPVYTYVHSKRLSFTGGTTDSIEYIHAVWEIGNHPSFTKLRVI